MAIKEDCYWYDYEQDMGARIPFCKLQKGFNPLQSCNSCSQYHSKYKKTEADCIRTMSDEELANLLAGGCDGIGLECKPIKTEPIFPADENLEHCRICWLDYLKKEADNGCAFCSECKNSFNPKIKSQALFCPRCGAKMDGGQDE